MNMPYNALDVAKYIIEQCDIKGKAISNLKLQKIMYFVQAKFLIETGDPCFNGRIEAWDFGPVVPEVYRKYKIYGSSSIPYIDDGDKVEFENNDKVLIDSVIDECVRYSASALVSITHQHTPWKEAYRTHSRLISNDSIREYFLRS